MKLQCEGRAFAFIYGSCCLVSTLAGYSGAVVGVYETECCIANSLSDGRDSILAAQWVVGAHSD